MLIGYARVSTEDQDTGLQIDALQRAGCEQIYEEQGSGANRARPELARMLEGLAAGDKVIVYKLDRLARSLADLLDILGTIERRGATFQSITETIDTKTSAGRMMMQMLGAFAEFERGMIVERTCAGIRAAKKRGVRLGRPTALSDEQTMEMARLYCSGKHSMTDLARRFGCHVSSIKRGLARMGLSSISVAHGNCADLSSRPRPTDARGRPLKRAKTLSRVLTDAQVKRAARRFAEGTSMTELGRAYGCTQATIRSALTRLGAIGSPAPRAPRPIETSGSTDQISIEEPDQVNRINHPEHLPVQLAASIEGRVCASGPTA